MLSVVVPFYKGKSFVRPLYARLVNACESIGVPFEMIFIEDGSNDGSWEEILSVSIIDKRLKAVKFSRNFGQHHAISAGLDLSSGDFAVVMDCDLQDRPEDIPRLYEKILEGYDVVFGKRTVREDPMFKIYAARIFYFLFNKISGMNKDPYVGTFRILSRTVIDAYRQMGEQIRGFGAQLQWLGFEAGYVEVEHAKRYEGKSSYSLRKIIKLGADYIIAYSDKPLRMSVKLGFIIALLSFFFALWLAYRKFFLGIPVEGWTSIMTSIWFLGGIIISNLGVIGIYLGKTFDETKKRPLYVISKKVNL